jgi:hypothetical protein
MGEECSTPGRIEKCIQNSGQAKLKGRPFEKPRRSWENSIEMDFRETFWKVVD